MVSGGIFLFAMSLLYIPARRFVQLHRELGLSNAELLRLNRMKDDFLANTSHELRTPLTGIIGLTDSLIEGVTGQLPHQTVANLRLIGNSARRLSSLVNDILDFFKLRHHEITLKRQRVDVAEVSRLVAATLDPLLRDKGLKLTDNLPLICRSSTETSIVSSRCSSIS
jgi:two-component system sensor histidine kinase ChiS